MTIEKGAFNRIKDDSPIFIMPKFGGYVSPSTFDQHEIQNLIPFHQEIAHTFLLENPYYEFTDKGIKEVVNICLNNDGLILKAGNVGAFSAGEVGAFVQEQSRNYVDKTTMGYGFPQGNIDSEQELLSMFINDFDINDVLITAQEIKENGFQIVAGAKMVRGKSNRYLRDTSSDNIYYQEGNISTLPTFYALKIRRSPDGTEKLLDVSEDNSVCISRYWRQDDLSLARMNFCDTRIPVHIIAAMPLAYTLSAYTSGDVQNIPSRAVFDIHRGEIASFVRDNFDAHIIAQGDQVKSTDEILKTILKYHYGDPENGGYSGKITVGIFETAAFLSKSLKYFDRVKINFDSDTLQILNKIIAFLTQT